MGPKSSTEEAAAPTDAELKEKLRAIWSLGDYASVARELIPELGTVLVDAVGITPNERVLDIAAGSGNASIPAAEAGAEVVASDLTPDLLAVGRAAADPDLPIDWQEADAEHLPYEDGSFDAVISCVGVMFAPHHQDAADELLRVCRTGGRIGLVSWTPEGFIGQMFAAMKPYAPPPPPGAQPPPSWGSEGHLRDLLGERVFRVELTRRALRVDRFGSAADFREFFKSRYGPTIAVYRANEAEPEKCAALDQALDELAERFGVGRGPMEWEYLLATATRR